MVCWRGEWYEVQELWQRDAQEEREASPDRRPFLLPDREGGLREVHGYRGDRRGLSPADARLTVNLSLTPGCQCLLDPFAGAGGIVSAARDHALLVLSTDIDPFVAPGLSALGALHAVADARTLPLPAQSIDAIASEPPYAPDLGSVAAEAIVELTRVLRPGGRLCLFCSETQRESLLKTANSQLLRLLHTFPIDRKGTDCTALVWERH
jgi:hypothetical protein